MCGPLDARGATKRAERRWAWRCDCDGTSHTKPGTLVDPLVEHVIVQIRKQSGETLPPPACPWRCLEDELVGGVMHIRRRAAAGMALEPLSLRLVDAVAYYERCYQSALAARREAERPKPPGEG